MSTSLSVAAQPAAKPKRKRSSWLRYLLDRPNLVRLISVTVFVFVWEYVGRQMDPLFMTYPTAVAQATVELMRTGELVQAMLASFIPFLIGLAISLAAGIVIGLLMGQFEVVEYLIDPYVNALIAIPRVALVPLIILWFGLELQGKIVIIVSVAMFPVIINTYAGVKDVRGSLLEIGKAYGATEMQTFVKIIMPAALPFIMVGTRLAVSYAIIGMIVAEFFTAIRGLGGLIVFFSNNFATAKLFVPIVVVGLMGIACTQSVLALERWLAPWRASERLRG